MSQDPLTNPEEIRVAVAFAESLAKGDWSGAHLMLASSLRDDWQAVDLKEAFASMTSYWDNPPTEVKLGMSDSDWIYVEICSRSDKFGTVQEAINVHIIEENNRWFIDEIIWGRP